jgi:hypothetical protein
MRSGSGAAATRDRRVMETRQLREFYERCRAIKATCPRPPRRINPPKSLKAAILT